MPAGEGRRGGGGQATPPAGGGGGGAGGGARAPRGRAEGDRGGRVPRVVVGATPPLPDRAAEGVVDATGEVAGRHERDQQGERERGQCERRETTSVAGGHTSPR